MGALSEDPNQACLISGTLVQGATGKSRPGQFTSRIGGKGGAPPVEPRKIGCEFQGSGSPAGKELYRATKPPCLHPCHGGWHGRWSVCNEGSFTLADAIGASPSVLMRPTRHSPQIERV